MIFKDLQQEISKYVYSEDQGMSRIAIASIIATRKKLGDPVWMILIGASSSGKSQILRPLAMTDNKFIHRIDDLTENTLLSGVRVKKGEKEISLLKRIGSLGIIVISDLTVLFSKNSESKNAILGQFRMVYDGEMTKFSGTNSEPITWKGSLGVLAGSTPSIYSHFEEVADMGERFIYYRMKPYNIEKATRLSLDRKIFGKDLDSKLSSLYEDYIKDVVKNQGDMPAIDGEVHERILNISMFAAILRTPTHYDKYAKQIDKVPVPEMPMRVALQLTAITKGLMTMRYHDTNNTTWLLEEEDISYIEWCAYSLANEERRACLKILAGLGEGEYIKTQIIADQIGLSTSIIGMNLQHLSAIGILERFGYDGSLSWRIKDKKVWEIVRRLENIGDKNVEYMDRNMSDEETMEDVSTQDKLSQF